MADKTLLEVKVLENIDELKQIWANADEQIKGQILAMLGDSKELLNHYVDLKMLANDVIDIVDDMTNTGLMDVVDGPIMKSAVNLFLIKKETEIWWDEKRAELLFKIENSEK